MVPFCFSSWPCGQGRHGLVVKAAGWLSLDRQGRRGLVVKAAGWLSLDRQFEPYPRARANLNTVTVARRPRGVAWDAVPEP